MKSQFDPNQIFKPKMIDYLLSVAIISLIWVIIAQSYNLSFGLTGLFNLGHIIFYGVGAYSAAILNTKFGIGFFENIFISAVVSGFFAAFFGLLCLRLSDHYLAIATLGAAMISGVVATNWVGLTHGPFGIRGIESPNLWAFHFDSERSVFSLYFVITAIVLFLLWKIFRSPFSRILRAIKNDEIAATAVGKNVFKAKMWSLCLSAAFAGIAGAMYVHYRLFLDPTIFALPEIIFAILIVVVGGRGNFWGVIASVFCVQILAEIPRFFDFPDEMIGAMRNLMFAVLLIGIMFFRPEGIFKKRLKIKH